mgnify:CR=1 FL=1
MTNIHNHKILILDFGSQYTQLIARRVREIGVYCELWAWDVTEEQIREFNPDGIILSGGPESTTEANSPRAPEYVFNAGVPVLGICYGMQTMAMQLGGLTETSEHREFGYASVLMDNPTALFAHLNDGDSKLDVWMSHGDKVTRLPENFQVTGTTPTCPIAAMSDENRRFYGVQFHPEVTHTKKGLELLMNFVVNICGCETKWTAENIIEDAVARIKEQVGDDEVILGLSGGVDSSVVALLLHRAIGKNLHCVFVDNGLLRLHEGDQVMEMFGDKFGLNITRVDAESRFLGELAGVSDPEAKRKIIGKVFVDVFDDESKKLTNVKWLAQGTIYPDVIESGTGEAEVIKSHHNVGGLPAVVDFKGLIEPLRNLFKDEVRELGSELGLADYLVWRQPFPGPGLAIRVMGEITKDKLDILRDADYIFRDEIAKAGLDRDINQYFAVLTSTRTVGVMGDFRTYDYTLALRGVTTTDFMTADWARIPYDVLDTISRRIVNEVQHINRIVYDITSKPPATIEWE